MVITLNVLMGEYKARGEGREEGKDNIFYNFDFSAEHKRVVAFTLKTLLLFWGLPQTVLGIWLFQSIVM